MSLSKYFNQAAPSGARMAVAVIGAPSMEGFVNKLMDSLPHVTVHHVKAEHLGLESQQIDEAERKAMIMGVQTQLTDFAKAHPNTGPVHVYLLDGKGLAAGDEGSQATLSALAAAAMNDPTNTVAAFLPEDESICPRTPGLPDGTPQAIRDVVHQFMDHNGKASVEGLDGLIKYLSDRTSG